MMSWNCRMITYGKETTSKTMQIGDMFYAPTKEEMEADDALPEDQQKGLWWIWAKAKDSKLCDYYWANNSHRRPLLVYLPGNLLFCVDCGTVADGVYSKSGWTVTGVPPHITVYPSINVKGIYHGYLTNGVIGDECEGRKYNEQGHIIR
jgi:hypothetical protein